MRRRDFPIIMSGPTSVAASPVLELPQVASATLLLNLQADALALNDNDPVGTWADASGNGYDFTQTGAARPTYKAGGGIPYLYFPVGGGVYLSGGNLASFDNKLEFSVFSVHSFSYQEGGFNSYVIAKYDTNNGTGWTIETDYYISAWQDYSIFVQKFHGVNDIPDIDYGAKHVVALEKISNSSLNMFIDGVESQADVNVYGSVSTFATSEPVIIGNNWADVGVVDYKIYGILVYSGVPNTSDRQAIEAWLAAKYGVTLP